MKVSTGLRDQIRAVISDAYYDSRNAQKTMEQAADLATKRVVALIDKAPLESQEDESEPLSYSRYIRSHGFCGSYQPDHKFRTCMVTAVRGHVFVGHDGDHATPEMDMQTGEITQISWPQEKETF